MLSVRENRKNIMFMQGKRLEAMIRIKKLAVKGINTGEDKLSFRLTKFYRYLQIKYGE